MNTPTSSVLENQAPIVQPRRQAQTTIQAARVLLVGDNHDHQRPMQLMLRELGVHAVLDQNGQQEFEAILGGGTARLILLACTCHGQNSLTERIVRGASSA